MTWINTRKMYGMLRSCIVVLAVSLGLAHAKPQETPKYVNTSFVPTPSASGCCFVFQPTVTANYWDVNTTRTVTYSNATVTTLYTIFEEYDDGVVTIYTNITRSNFTTTSLTAYPHGENPLFLHANDAPGPAEESVELTGTATVTGGVEVKYPAAFYVYTKVEIITVQPIVEDDETFCGTTSSNYNFRKVYSDINENAEDAYFGKGPKGTVVTISLETPFIYQPVRGATGATTVNTCDRGGSKEDYGYVPQKVIDYLVGNPQYSSQFPGLASCLPGGPAIQNTLCGMVMSTFSVTKTFGGSETIFPTTAAVSVAPPPGEFVPDPAGGDLTTAAVTTIKKNGRSPGGIAKPPEPIPAPVDPGHGSNIDGTENGKKPGNNDAVLIPVPGLDTNNRKPSPGNNDPPIVVPSDGTENNGKTGQPPADNQIPAGGNEQISNGGTKQPPTGNQNPAGGNEQTSNNGGAKQPPTGSQNPAGGNEQASTDETKGTSGGGSNNNNQQSQAEKNGGSGDNRSGSQDGSVGAIINSIMGGAPRPSGTPGGGNQVNSPTNDKGNNGGSSNSNNVVNGQSNGNSNNGGSSNANNVVNGQANGNNNNGGSSNANNVVNGQANGKDNNGGSSNSNNVVNGQSNANSNNNAASNSNGNSKGNSNGASNSNGNSNEANKNAAQPGQVPPGQIGIPTQIGGTNVIIIPEATMIPVADAPKGVPGRTSVINNTPFIVVDSPVTFAPVAAPFIVVPSTSIPLVDAPPGLRGSTKVVDGTSFLLVDGPATVEIPPGPQRGLTTMIDGVPFLLIPGPTNIPIVGGLDIPGAKTTYVSGTPYLQVTSTATIPANSAGSYGQTTFVDGTPFVSFPSATLIPVKGAPAGLSASTTLINSTPFFVIPSATSVPVGSDNNDFQSTMISGTPYLLIAGPTAIPLSNAPADLKGKSTMINGTPYLLVPSKTSVAFSPRNTNAAQMGQLTVIIDGTSQLIIAGPTTIPVNTAFPISGQTTVISGTTMVVVSSRTTVKGKAESASTTSSAASSRTEPVPVPASSTSSAGAWRNWEQGGAVEICVISVVWVVFAVV